MNRPQKLLLLILILCATSGLWVSASAPIPPAPRDWCTDGAGFLSEQARAGINSRLQGLERESGLQVIVYIADSIGDAPLEDWCARAFKEWGVGRKGLDNGLVLFVFAKDQLLRIEVGYGLEGTVPDAIASRIIREVIVPKIQSGDRDGAIRDGVEAIISAAGGKPAAGTAAEVQPAAPQESEGRKVSVGEMIFLSLLVIGFLILLITNPSVAIWLLFEVLFSVIGGGSGGGGRSSGGGFSGGGGRSGGGGASGRW